MALQAPLPVENARARYFVAHVVDFEFDDLANRLAGDKDDSREKQGNCTDHGVPLIRS
jgi:hypothetical protein